MTSSVQSLNPVVLRNIKRDNISLETYAEVQKELHKQGMQSYGELIPSMPGETKQSFMEGVAWAQDHYNDLIDGDLGGNLLSKYSMTGRFIILRESLEFLQETVPQLLVDADADAMGMMGSIFRYYDSIMLHVPFADTLENAPKWVTEFDVIGWREAGYSADLDSYKFKSAKQFRTHIDPRVKETLTSRIETFGEHASGLGRFTRTMFATDFRRIVSQEPVQSSR